MRNCYLTKLTFALIFLLLLCWSVPVWALGGGAISATVAEDNIGFDVLLMDESTDWKKMGSLSFDQFLREKRMTLECAKPSTGSIKLKLVQRGGGGSHIDQIVLGGTNAVALNGTKEEGGLNKLSKSDLDLYHVNGGTAEFDFPFNGGTAELILSARIEGAIISKTPFQLPKENLYQQIDGDSKFYTYTLDSCTERVAVDGEIGEASGFQPYLREFVMPGSGHPPGYIYAWVLNNSDNLFVVLDTTPDNTLDGEKDYATVHVKTPQGVKSFRVSASENKWGRPGFTYTDKVGYQHKVYEFAIPLSQIGINVDNASGKVEFALEAYGTMAPLPPVNFLPRVDYSTPGQVNCIAQGDFNKDNHLDLVASDSNNSRVYLLTGSGNGTFTVEDPFDTGYAPTKMAVGLFDGDANLDLAVTGNSGVYVHLGHGDGTFENHVTYSTGTSPNTTVAGDVYGNDGIMDLVVTNSNSSNITLLAGNGDGTFSNITDIAVFPNGPTNMIEGDFDNDGNLDIAYTSYNIIAGSTNLTVLLQSEGGSFDVSHEYPVESPGGLTCADFDGDGVIDLAVTSWTTFGNPGKLYLFKGNGDGSFSNENMNHVDDSGAAGIVTGDFNRDGITSDMAVAYQYSDKISVFPGYGYTFNLSSSTDFATESSPTSMVAGDFNSDGTDDLALVYFQGSTVSVLLNSFGEMSDAEAVALDKGALSFSSIRGSNTAEDNIISNLSLPGAGSNGTTISWSSSNTDFISNGGTVNRPPSGQNDQRVTLTATLRKGALSDTVVFNLLVKANAPSGGGGGGGGGSSAVIPSVKSFGPVKDAADIAVHSEVSVTFNMDVEEVDLAGVKVVSSNGKEVNNVKAKLNGRTLVINHDPFSYDTKYTITIPAKAVKGKDGSYNSLITWSFTTVKEKKEEAVKLPFTDLPLDHWAYGYVKKLYEAKISGGYPDGTFRPEKNITRAEFTALLAKALGLPERVEGSRIFADVPESSWYYGSLQAAASAGLVKGYGGNLFCPDHNISRQEMTAMLIRALDLRRGAETLSFTDAEQIAPWAKDSVAIAVKEGLVSGYPDNTFKPLKNATRAEVGAMICRLLDKN